MGHCNCKGHPFSLYYALIKNFMKGWCNLDNHIMKVFNEKVVVFISFIRDRSVYLNTEIGITEFVLLKNILYVCLDYINCKL